MKRLRSDIFMVVYMVALAAGAVAMSVTGRWSYGMGLFGALACLALALSFAVESRLDPPSSEMTAWDTYEEQLKNAHSERPARSDT